MYNLLYDMMIIFIYLKCRPETPPNTPQRARAAARQNERDNRNLDSPQHRRIPHHADPPQIPPLQYNNLPIPQPLPFPGNTVVPDDPFALPPPPVHLNGQQYQHLPQHLAQQIQNLPAFPVAQPVQHQGHGHMPAVSVNLTFLCLIFWRLNFI
jgi:hypothetical protein